MSDENIRDITPEVEAVEAEIVDDIDDALKTLREKSPGGLLLSKVDLALADRNSERSLDSAIQNKELIESLKPIFDEYNRKYNTNLNYDNFQSAIQFAALAKKDEKDIKRVINSEIVTSVVEYVIIKGILVAARLIDTQIDNIQSKVYTDNLSIEAVGMVTSIFNWVEKLEVIKDKYSQYDIDSKIKLLNTFGSNKDDSTQLMLIDLLKKSISSG